MNSPARERLPHVVVMGAGLGLIRSAATKGDAVAYPAGTFFEFRLRATGSAQLSNGSSPSRTTRERRIPIGVRHFFGSAKAWLSHTPCS